MEVTRPPITTVANGRCTSAPALVARAIGKKPKEGKAGSTESDWEVVKDDEKDKKKSRTEDISAAKDIVQPLLMEHIDASAVSELPREELAEQVGEVVGELLVQEKINLNLR